MAQLKTAKAEAQDPLCWWEYKPCITEIQHIIETVEVQTDCAPGGQHQTNRYTLTIATP
jgi:hypothetical protein